MTFLFAVRRLGGFCFNTILKTTASTVLTNTLREKSGKSTSCRWKGVYCKKVKTFKHCRQLCLGGKSLIFGLAFKQNLIKTQSNGKKHGYFACSVRPGSRFTIKKIKFHLADKLAKHRVARNSEAMTMTAFFSNITKSCIRKAFFMRLHRRTKNY